MWTRVRCILEIVELDDSLFVEFSPAHRSCGGVHAFDCGLVSCITFLNASMESDRGWMPGSVAGLTV